MRVLGETDELKIIINQVDLDELKDAGNSLDRLRTVIARTPNKFDFNSKTFNAIERKDLDDAIKDTARWDEGLTGKALAHARGTEAAILYAKQKGYQILYADSGKPIKQLGGLPAKTNKYGPDIIAINPATGKTVIIEAKGYWNDLELGQGNIVQNQKLGRAEALPTTQNSFEWLSLNPDRYRNILLNANDATTRSAAARIDAIIFNGETYETIIVAAGNNPQLGRNMDLALEQLDKQTTSVEIIKITW